MEGSKGKTDLNYGGLDRFRVAAALLVIAIHTSPLASVSDGADFFLTRVLARVAVPFFLMVTGHFVAADFLDPAVRNVQKLKDYLKKTALLYAVCMILYLPAGIYAGHYRDLSVGTALRMLFFDGTFYHLWYFPACMIGVSLVYLMSLCMSRKILTIVSAVLYLIGLFGDSYYGLAQNIPVLKSVYDFGFRIFSYTRNGLFLAPLFLVLGAWIGVMTRLQEKAADNSDAPRGFDFSDRKTGALLLGGMILCFVNMTVEAFVLRHFQLQRHDSMYLALVPTVLLLYLCLLCIPRKSVREFRVGAMWIYILHPAVIIVVRGIAKLLHLTKYLVDNSVIHYISVTLLSVAAGFLAVYIRKYLIPRFLPLLNTFRQKLQNHKISITKAEETNSMAKSNSKKNRKMRREQARREQQAAEAAKYAEAPATEAEAGKDAEVPAADAEAPATDAEAGKDAEVPAADAEAPATDAEAGKSKVVSAAIEVEKETGKGEQVPETDPAQGGEEVRVADPAQGGEEVRAAESAQGGEPQGAENTEIPEAGHAEPEAGQDIKPEDGAGMSSLTEPEKSRLDESVLSGAEIRGAQVIGTEDDLIVPDLEGEDLLEGQMPDGEEGDILPDRSAVDDFDAQSPDKPPLPPAEPRKPLNIQGIHGAMPQRKQGLQRPIFRKSSNISSPGNGEFRQNLDRLRAWIELDGAALAHNVEFLRARLPERCRLMPAVKAEAYGHGAVLIARQLNRLNVNAFCVACLSEGVALRKAGVKGKILILGITPFTDFPLLKRYQLIQTVVDYPYAQMLNRFGQPTHVHIAIDTGMHRLGIRCENLEEIMSVYQMKNLIVDGLFTHLSASDSLRPEDRAFTESQVQAFYQVIDILRENGYPCPGLHLLSSYGILNLLQEKDRQENYLRRLMNTHGGLNHADLAADYVRPGIALYGLLSTEADSNVWRDSLQPVLSLKAKVISVRPLYMGEAAGYGLAFTAKYDMQIAAVSIGYADGLPRELSYGIGSVLINGVKAPIIGRICMDQTLVDVSNVPGVKAGNVAVIIGKSGDQEITADQLAEQCGTITNEILSRLGARLERIMV